MIDCVTIQGLEYEICDCPSCGVIYTISKRVRDSQRENGGRSYCPNGHNVGWDAGGSENSRTRRERDQLKQEIAERDDEIAGERSRRLAAEKQAETERRRAVSLKKRAAAGVCPCCNRTFSALAQHIATRHPTFRAEDVARENVVSIIKAKAS